VAVKIRLMRVGKKKQPTYRVVVADSRSPRDGRFIEIIGRYSPRSSPKVVAIDSDKALAWLHKGAQPTEQTAKLLEISGVWERYAAETGKPAAAKPKPKTPAPKAIVVPEATPEGSSDEVGVSQDVGTGGVGDGDDHGEPEEL